MLKKIYFLCFSIIFLLSASSCTMLVQKPNGEILNYKLEDGDINITTLYYNDVEYSCCYHWDKEQYGTPDYAFCNYYTLVGNRESLNAYMAEYVDGKLCFFPAYKFKNDDKTIFIFSSNFDVFIRKDIEEKYSKQFKSLFVYRYFDFNEMFPEYNNNTINGIVVECYEEMKYMKLWETKLYFDFFSEDVSKKTCSKKDVYNISVNDVFVPTTLDRFIFNKEMEIIQEENYKYLGQIYFTIEENNNLAFMPCCLYEYEDMIITFINGPKHCVIYDGSKDFDVQEPDFNGVCKVSDEYAEIIREMLANLK